MYTLKETAHYTKTINALFSIEEQGELHTYIANNATAGNVIPNSGGCRKLRWTREGVGKRSGVRVIYYNQLDNGLIVLLLAYAKAKQENIPSHILKQIVMELEQ